MLAIGKEIRYRIAAILGAHWEDFFQAHKGWIRPVVLETVRKIVACRTPALGCHVYACPDGHEIRVVPHSPLCQYRVRRSRVEYLLSLEGEREGIGCWRERATEGGRRRR
jgi:hypothetical protein